MVKSKFLISKLAIPVLSSILALSPLESISSEVPNSRRVEVTAGVLSRKNLENIYGSSILNFQEKQININYGKELSEKHNIDGLVGITYSEISANAKFNDEERNFYATITHDNNSGKIRPLDIYAIGIYFMIRKNIMITQKLHAFIGWHTGLVNSNMSDGKFSYMENNIVSRMDQEFIESENSFTLGTHFGLTFENEGGLYLIADLKVEHISNGGLSENNYGADASGLLIGLGKKF